MAASSCLKIVCLMLRHVLFTSFWTACHQPFRIIQFATQSLSWWFWWYVDIRDTLPKKHNIAPEKWAVFKRTGLSPNHYCNFQGRAVVSFREGKRKPFSKMSFSRNETPGPWLGQSTPNPFLPTGLLNGNRGQKLSSRHLQVGILMVTGMKIHADCYILLFLLV